GPHTGPPRHAEPRPRPGVLRALHPEPRPGRQLGDGPALPPPDQPRPLPGDDGAAAPGPRDADAVPGAGVRLGQPVPLLRRPQERTGETDRQGAGGGPGPVPQCRPPRDASVPARPRRPPDGRVLPDRPARTPGARPG